MKIIVFCPANTATGGPEVLHQLCRCLLDLGYDAQMCYCGYDKSLHTTPVCECYMHYENPFVTTYIDSKDNVCIVPETMTKIFYDIKKGEKILWWLSVDNFINQLYQIHGFSATGNITQNIIKVVKMLTHRIYDIHQEDIAWHWTQSVYAQDWCQKAQIPRNKIFYLSDYLNDTYLANAKNNVRCKKEDRVLFNPKKGYQFTKTLIKAAPDLNWTPLVNLSYEDVVKLMQHSKVYIDFGSHPGKDRLPREAAVNGCCIITGKRGAAAYQKDINIPSEFKFEDRESSVGAIIQKIKNICANYEKNTCKFEQYREGIYQEKSQFYRDCDRFFRYMNR